MTLDIKLLGPPRIRTEDSEVQPRGRKAWALLAYLLLGPELPSRSHLSGLLFAEADDPARALRWNLTELRRVLDGVEMAGDTIAISLPPGSVVDALVATREGAFDAMGFDDLGRDLLEGHAFPGCPAFEAWLLSERRHLRSCAANVLREATLAHLASGSLKAAIDAAVRLVALDPFSEEDQTLLIRCYAAAGDTDAAARQFAACARLLRDELGVEPGEEVAAAIQAPRVATVSTPALGRHAVHAQLEAGTAAVNAGAIEAGVDSLRRAAAEAHSLADEDLIVDSLLALGTTLAHAGRRRHQEGATALHGVVDRALARGRASQAARAEMELAWIEFMAARYERAVRWTRAAAEHAPDDESVRCIALWIRGKCHMETGCYAASLADLESAAGLASGLDDAGRAAFCLASFGRTQMMMRTLPDARRSLERSLEIASEHGFTWTKPVAQAFLAEVEIADGNLERAEPLVERALAGARQVGDVSFESFALHARGAYAAALQREDEAVMYFESAYSRLVADPDCEWALAYALDGLADVTSRYGHPSAAGRAADLEALAGRSGMKEMVARSYVYKHRLGDADALRVAQTLAEEVDNPALHELVAPPTDPPASIPSAGISAERRVAR